MQIVGFPCRKQNAQEKETNNSVTRTESRRFSKASDDHSSSRQPAGLWFFFFFSSPKTEVTDENKREHVLKLMS
jgi:hypothetical protein